MLRLAIGVCLLTALIWFGGVYKLGEKTLAGHLDDVYQSPIVRQKLEALHRGFDDKLDDFAVERSRKETTKRRVQARAERLPPPPVSVPPPSKPASPMAPVDVRPNAGAPKKIPAHDSLTADDRDDLEKLLDQKLR